MTKETRVAICIDHSASMEPGQISALWNQTIAGLKRVNKGRGGQVWVHKVRFGAASSTRAEPPVKLEDCANMTPVYYRDGNTAIFDAMGRAWEALRDYDNRAGNVANLVIVATDGGENGSYLYDEDRVAEIVSRTTRNGSFTWVYLTTSNTKNAPGVPEQNVHQHSSITELCRNGIVKGLEGYFAARKAGYQAVETY